MRIKPAWRADIQFAGGGYPLVVGDDLTQVDAKPCGGRQVCRWRRVIAVRSEQKNGLTKYSVIDPDEVHSCKGPPGQRRRLPPRPGVQPSSTSVRAGALEMRDRRSLDPYGGHRIRAP